LGAESGSTGSYTSQATCVPADLDPITSGVLAPILARNGTEDYKKKQKDRSGKVKTEDKGGEETEEVRKDGSP
jgi:hypothetical protein